MNNLELFEDCLTSLYYQNFRKWFYEFYPDSNVPPDTIYAPHLENSRINLLKEMQEIYYENRFNIETSIQFYYTKYDDLRYTLNSKYHPKNVIVLDSDKYKVLLRELNLKSIGI